MTPDPPEPPAPTLPEITVNVANAQGVKYLNPSNPTVPDLQTYTSITFDGVDYTPTSASSAKKVYLFAIPRSANDGDTVKLGWTNDGYNGGVIYNGMLYSYVSGTGNESVYSGAPNIYSVGTNPSNAELAASIGSTTAEFILRVIH